jgi:iduronate 2-sulfatase
MQSHPWGPRRLLFGALAIALSTGILTRAAPAAEARKNVLFIVADDLNNLLGCYGDPLAKTPNLDKLAARGVRFESAYCAYPLCGPSRNSFLTGLYPNTTGIWVNNQVFRQSIPSQRSMPQQFRIDGNYLTVRVGKMYHYGVPGAIGTDGHDDPASWELQMNPAGVDRLEEQPKIFSLKPRQFGATLSWYASPKSDEFHTDGRNAADAQWVLERCAKDRSRPFFLAVGFFRPHTPYVSPQPYFDMHPAKDMPVVPGVKDDRADIPRAALMSGHPEQETMTDDQRRQTRQAYAASISFMDAQVGKVVDTLDKLGLSDDTVIVFTSDHGYHMGEHGLWQKMSLFEEVARIPLLIVAPGVSAKGAVVKAPVAHVDIFPTLAELCGVKPPANLQGQSLVPMLKDQNATGRGWAITQVMRGGGARAQGKRYVGYSLRTARWRYTEWDEGREGKELYDHDADPQEMKNLAKDAAHAKDVEGLAGQLKSAVKATLPPSGTPPEVKPGMWPPTLVEN